MTEESVPLSEDSRRQAAELDAVWQIAPAAANGAAMLALLNLVGNVDDPDAAIVALRWVFLLTGLGLVMGLVGLLLARSQRFHEHGLWRSMRGLEDVAEDMMSLDSGPPTRTTAPDRERLRQTMKETAERLAKLKNGTTTHFDNALRLRRYAEYCRQASILLLALAFLTGWTGHLMGRELQPSGTPTAQARRLAVPPPRAPCGPPQSGPRAQLDARPTDVAATRLRLA